MIVAFILQLSSPFSNHQHICSPTMYIGRQSIRVLSSSIHSTRHCRHTSSIHRPRIRVPTPFPVIESCPSPICPCRPAPADLDIDREQSLNGTMAAYTEQVLVCTGREDWKSRIEDEEGEHGEFVRHLRALLSRGGKFCDVSLIPKTHHALPVSFPTRVSMHQRFRRASEETGQA